MFKKIMKTIAVRLYEYAKIEERTRELEKRKQLIQNSVTIGESSWIYEKSEIDNYQNDKSKIVIGNDVLVKRLDRGLAAFQFVADVRNVNIDGARLTIKIKAPYQIEQLLTRQHNAVIFG